MNPYEQPGFYNADCMEAMRHFPDKFFDLAVVDPPYGINVTGRHKAPVLVGGVQGHSGDGMIAVTGKTRRKQRETDKPSWGFYRNPASQNFTIPLTIRPRRTKGISTNCSASASGRSSGAATSSWTTLAPRPA